MVVALPIGWTVGWIAGAAVVLIAAILLLAIISVAHRIANETYDIVDALDGVSGKTNALQQVAGTHLAVKQITNGLRRARGEGDLASSQPQGAYAGQRTLGPYKEREWGRRW